MRFELKPTKLLRGRFGADGIVTTVQVGRDSQSGFRGGRTDEVKDLLITVEWLPGPVFRDFREEPMLNGIPFGRTGGIVGDGDLEVEGIGKLGLDFRFPSTTTAAIAATRIGENEKLTGLGVVTGAFTLPPMGDGMSGEGRGVVRDANDNGSAVGEGLVNTVRDGNADGIGAEVMIMNGPGIAIPTSAVVVKVSDEFTFFGIDADNGQMPAPKAVT